MKSCSGVTLIEVMGVLALTGILMGVATLWLRPMDNPLETGAKNLESFFRQARGRALATTSAHRVVPASDERIAVEFADSCADTNWTLERKLRLDLPEDVTLTDTTWTVCFGSRGITEANTVVDLWHPEKGTRQVEVLIGGMSRVLR